MAATKTQGSFTREEIERIERDYPRKSDAEKFRLLQAQRILDQWKAAQRSGKRRRR